MHAFLVSPANYIDHPPLSQAVSASISQCFAFLIGSSGKASATSPSSGHLFLFFPIFFFLDFLVDFSFFFVLVLSTAGVLILAFAIDADKAIAIAKSSSIAAPVS